MRVCVDTTIFLDILKDELRDFQDKLYEALVRKEELVSPSVVYGELLPQFKGSTEQIDEFLMKKKGGTSCIPFVKQKVSINFYK